MKMSIFADEILDKEMLVKIVSYAGCSVCPFRKACSESNPQDMEETCEQFLNRYIEDDRNEG